MNLTSEQLKRFWAKVDRKGADQCWPWMGAKKKRGYGNFSIEKKMYAAHVVSWIIATGKQPTKFILHSCDNPSCVNPKHLREGTHLENMLEMRLKGRSNKWNARLTAEQVKAIRQTPGTQAALAKAYGVSNQTISQILRCITWQHI